MAEPSFDRRSSHFVEDTGVEKEDVQNFLMLDEVNCGKIHEDCGIFHYISKCPHSCNPNASYSLLSDFDDDKNITGYLQSNEDIEPGEVSLFSINLF